MDRLTKFKIIIYNIIYFAGIKKHVYLNSNDTIDYLLQSNKSLIRWGDGESAIFFGRSIKFQCANKDISSDLKRIIQSYSENKSDFLLAGPNLYLQASLLDLIKIKKLTTWLHTRYIFGRIISKGVILGDAFIFRPLSLLKNDDIERLWSDSNVVLIHSRIEVYNDFKNKYAHLKVGFVAIDDLNAYDSVTLILQKVENVCFENGFNKNNTKILISAGPTAKVLVYKLTEIGYISYDIGQYFNWKFYGKLNQKGI